MVVKALVSVPDVSVVLAFQSYQNIEVFKVTHQRP